MNDTPTLSPLVWDGERAPLAKALVSAQKATESIKKAATNPAFKSKYADLAHVVEGVIPALNNAGVYVMQCPAFDGDLVAVTTTLLHESGASVTSTLHLRPSKSDPQGVGSAITYARRYALLAMTGAAPEDDDANAASGPRQSQARPEPKRVEPAELTLADRADRLAARLKEAAPEDVEKAWTLGQALRDVLAKEDPKTLSDLTHVYMARKQKEAA